MVTLSLVCPRVQNWKHEVCWAFGHTWGFTGWGLGMHLMFSGHGNLAELQVAFKERGLIRASVTTVRTPSGRDYAKEGRWLGYISKSLAYDLQDLRHCLLSLEAASNPPEKGLEKLGLVLGSTGMTEIQKKPSLVC